MKESPLSFGDFDTGPVNLQNVDVGHPNSHHRANNDLHSDFASLPGGDPYHPNIYVKEIDPALRKIIDTAISNMTEQEKYDALVEHYISKLQSETTKQHLEERKEKLRSKSSTKKMLSIFIALVGFVLLIILGVVTAVVIITSLQSGSVTETGIIPSIISFFVETIRAVLGGV